MTFLPCCFNRSNTHNSSSHQSMSAKKSMHPRHSHTKGRAPTFTIKRVALLVAVCVALLLWWNWNTSAGRRHPPHHTADAPRAAGPSDNRVVTPLRYTSATLPNACAYRNFSSNTQAHKEHIAGLLEHILSFGPRVGGSSSTGYYGVMGSLITMMQCSSDDNDDTPIPSKWSLSFDNFTDSTPIGMMQFTNLISTIENPHFVNGDREPIDRSKRRSFPRATGKKRLSHLVLAAHWDSKLMVGPKPFLGACDSVVPMLIVLEMMKMVSHTFAMAAKGDSYNLGIARNHLPKKITVIFFDGEEAFVHWRGTDHTYGSRHLSSEWQQNGNMKSIDLFALLDLMGPPGLVFHDLLPRDSGAFFESLSRAEKNLRSQGRLLTSHTAFPDIVRRFPPIDDDHIHWQPHVPVLHMIAFPFPRVWHTVADDATAIDMATTIDLLHILALGLVGFPPQ